MQYLLINQHPPFDGYTAQESLDLAIALSTFEQTVQLLFMGDGILQLLKDQRPNLVYKKNFIATFKALALYDISAVYVDEVSMHNRMLRKNDLILEVAVINAEAISKVMSAVDVVLNMG